MSQNLFPELRLKPGKERSLLRRHPWVFSGAVGQNPKAAEGDIIKITDDKGGFLAYGLYDPQSQIRCRIFEFEAERSVFDEVYWMDKFRNAWTLRKKLVDPSKTTGFRLIHAEGDYVPGIITDIYGDLASVQIRIKGALALRDPLVKFLEDELHINHIYVSEAINKVPSTGSGQRPSTGSGQRDEKTYWHKGGKERADFLENGHAFSAQIEGGQKTGYFLDQRENRALVQHFAKGRRALDLFSYAGGFAVHAMAGGAVSVDSVDSSAQANEQAKTNLEKNFPSGNFKVLQADCFDFLKKMEANEYDLIVLDPPAFTKHISTVDKAARGYKEINLKAIKKISAGGLLFTYSCSQHISADLFRKIIFGAATDAGRKVRILHILKQAPDHPIDIFHPEGEYLKGLLLFVE